MKYHSRIWFVSDMHLEHANMIKLCNRPYPNVEEMNADIIKIFNSYVCPGDLVYDLGDSIWSTGDINLLKQLNGNKILVRGNHDKNTNRYISHGGYMAVMLEAELMICKNRVRLSHYPYRYGKLKSLLWSIKHRITGDSHILKHLAKRPVEAKQWLLHGHTHSTEKYKAPYQIHVGWDSWNRPVNIQDIEQIIQSNCNLKK